MELKVSIQEWNRRIPDYRVNPDIPIRHHVGTTFSLENLPLVFCPESAGAFSQADQQDFIGSTNMVHELRYENDECIVIIDRNTCIGSGNCVFNGPDVFDPDESGLAIVDRLDAKPLETVQFTAESCPVMTITFRPKP